MDNSGISSIGFCLLFCVHLGVKVVRGGKSTSENEGISDSYGRMSERGNRGLSKVEI